MEWLKFWGLSRDPFGSDEPISYDDDHIADLVVENEAIRFLKPLIRFAPGIGPKKYLVLGDGGSGKSQALHCLMREALDTIYQNKVLPIYIPFTRISSFDDLKKFATEESGITKGELMIRLDHDFADITLQALTTRLQGMLSDFKIDLSKFDSRDDGGSLKEAVKWATRYYVSTDNERRSMAERGKIDSRPIAVLEALLRQLGKRFDKVLLIYDELDKIESPDLLLRFLSQSRGLLSLFAQNNCMIVMAGRLKWSDLLEGGQYRDIFGRPIFIKSLNAEGAYRMLKLRMEAYGCKDLPFDNPEDLSFLVSENAGNPRYILSSFRSIVQQMARSGLRRFGDFSVSEIPEELVRRLEQEIEGRTTLAKGYQRLKATLKYDNVGDLYPFMATLYKFKRMNKVNTNDDLRKLGFDMDVVKYSSILDTLRYQECIEVKREIVTLSPPVNGFFSQAEKFGWPVSEMPRLVTVLGSKNIEERDFPLGGYIRREYSSADIPLSLDEVLDRILNKKSALREAKECYGDISKSELRSRFFVGALQTAESMVNIGVLTKIKEGEIEKYIDTQKHMKERYERLKEKPTKFPEETAKISIRNAKASLVTIESELADSQPTINETISSASEIFEKLMKDNLIVLRECSAFCVDPVLIDEAEQTYNVYLQKLNQLVEQVDASLEMIIVGDFRKVPKGLEEHLGGLVDSVAPFLKEKIVELPFAETWTQKMGAIIERVNTITEYSDRIKAIETLSERLRRTEEDYSDSTVLDVIRDFELHRHEYSKKVNQGKYRHTGKLLAGHLDRNIGPKVPDYVRLDVVAPTILQSLGIYHSGYSLFDFRKSLSKRTFKHVFCVFLDGLGFHQLRHFCGLDDEIESFFSLIDVDPNEDVIPVLSTFPSDTPVCLSTMFTGCMPNLHGIVGRRFMDPSSHTIVDIFGDEKRQKNVEWNRVSSLTKSSILPMLKREEVNVGFFCEGEMSKAFCKHVLHAPYKTVQQKKNSKEALAGASKTSQSESSFSIVSIDMIDGESHTYGPYSENAFTATKNCFKETQRFVDNLDPDVRSDSLLLLLSDHGLTEAYPKSRINLFEEDKLQSALVGEPSESISVVGSRVAYIYLNPKEKSKDALDEVQDYLQSTYHGMSVMKKGDALLRKLFLSGSSVGDLVCVGGPNFVFETPGESKLSEHIAFHGGLSLEEMTALLIPVDLSRSM